MSQLTAIVINMTIREIQKSEYEELRSVWCEVFGDDPVFVDELYYLLKATGYVCEDEGKLHSFLTLFSAGAVDGQQVQVSYGICTRPESRGKGYAGALVKHVRNLVVDNGDVSLICPAEESLVEFYYNLGYTPALFARNCSVEADELPLQVKMLGADEYNRYREKYLECIPHVTFTDEFMKFIKNDSVNAQGLLLINGGDAICTISYGTDDEMGLSELLINPDLAALSSEIAEQIAGALANLFEVKTIYFRTPTFIVYTDKSGDKFSQGSYAQAMIAGCTKELDVEAMLPYYGFPID